MRNATKGLFKQGINFVLLTKTLIIYRFISGCEPIFGVLEIKTEQTLKTARNYHKRYAWSRASVQQINDL
jgi:hypothetical protein